MKVNVKTEGDANQYKGREQQSSQTWTRRGLRSGEAKEA
jgi:hypothetical protein